jgi:RNA polymerase sigma-70 factor (ECF subfamily)
VSLSSKMDVYSALRTLKEAERTCITLFYMEDMSMDKIADVTGYPLGTVKSHLSRGREKMTTYLKNNGYEDRR